MTKIHNFLIASIALLIACDSNTIEVEPISNPCLMTKEETISNNKITSTINYDYDSNGNLIKQTSIGSTGNSSFFTMSYEFDSEKNITLKKYLDKDSKVIQTEEMNYFLGKKLRSKVVKMFLANFTIINIDEYNSSSKLLYESRKNSSQHSETINTYDSNNNLSTRELKTNGKTTSYSTYTYDQKNRVIKSTSISNGFSISSESTYDDTNNSSKIISSDGSITTYTRDLTDLTLYVETKRNGIVTSKWKSIYLDKDFKKVAKGYRSVDNVNYYLAYEYSYHSNGNVKSNKQYNLKENSKTETYLQWEVIDDEFKNNLEYSYVDFNFPDRSYKVKRYYKCQ